MRKVKIVNVPADFTNIINLQISSLIFALRFFGVKTAKEKNPLYLRIYNLFYKLYFERKYMYVCYHTFYGCVSYLITTVVTVVLGNNGHTLTKKNAKLCISCFHEIGFIANVWKKWGIALQAIWIRDYLLVSELSCNNHCPSSLPDRHTYHKTWTYIANSWFRLLPLHILIFDFLFLFVF